MLFIRFVVGHDSEKLNKLHGPFTEAKLLRDEGALRDYEVEQVEEVLFWFNDNLPCPPFESENYPIDAVAWFKPNANDFINRMHELSYILNEHNAYVRVIKTKSPGRKVYEDEYQVVYKQRILSPTNFSYPD